MKYIKYGNKIIQCIILIFILTNVGAITNEVPIQLTTTPIKIVAAENFYGELASEIGGHAVIVKSIMSNPDTDPHLFTTSSEVYKDISTAKIIIYNGANYDLWIEQILKAINNKNVIVINVADLMHVTPGMNPHIWYKPATFPTLARVLAAKIISLESNVSSDTANNNKVDSAITRNLEQFLKQNNKVADEIKQIKAKYIGIKVTATEPVFGYMADAMGLKMQGLDFQWAIMNGTEPSPKMLASYEAALTSHSVKLLFYNNQVTDSVTRNILALAKKNSIPVIGVSETMPPNMKINSWLINEIINSRNALATIR